MFRDDIESHHAIQKKEVNIMAAKKKAKKPAKRKAAKKAAPKRKAAKRKARA